MTRPLLIAGIGNLFLGDDAFGCEVIRRLAERHAGKLRDGVELRDFGIGVRGLGYALADMDARTPPGAGGTMILVDALSTGGAPGTVQLLDLSVAPLPAARYASGHVQSLQDALTTARALGARLPRLYLLGCEPASLVPAWNTQLRAASILTPAVEAAARISVQWLGRLLEEPDAELVSLCAM